MNKHVYMYMYMQGSCGLPGAHSTQLIHMYKPGIGHMELDPLLTLLHRFLEG